MSEMHIIVGAGQAGGWAAMGMRQAGFTGRILLIGEEPWRPYERPPLSKAMLTAPEEPPPAYFHPAERYAEQGIELMLGAAVEEIMPTERRIRLRGGDRLAYDKLLIATGGRARRLPVHGGEHALYLRTLDEARAIRVRLREARRVVCIGAGVIGLEIASSACALGAQVTVLEALAAPMGRCVSPEGARFVERLHAGAGVELRCGEIVQAIERDGGSFRVICRDGVEESADLVLAGVGMERNLMLARDAGLVLEGGIVVDEHGATSEPGIYAAGDVAAFYHPLYGRRLRLESWRHAQNHGLAVGRAMAGDPAPYEDVPWFWTDQHGVNLQVAGLPAEAARTIVRVDNDKAFTAAHLVEDGTIIGLTAANAPRDIRAATAMIRAGRRPDPARLADPAIPLQSVQ
ncbi:MAG: FAD-dependent oxidoreductase [Alphaproteobacteria bacterium]|nr:FAD-dependent oxidoreductase [Alphaproteobacteria bacterium]